MKRIQYLIIGLFVFIGILSALLYQQKSNRIDTQVEKRNLGWNPVSIKKIIISQADKDTVVLSKKDGIWKTDRQFDGMGIATQIIHYLSTMQLKATTENMDVAMKNAITLQTFDKYGTPINSIAVGGQTKEGECVAIIDTKPTFIVISNTHNNISLRKLLDELTTKEN